MHDANRLKFAIELKYINENEQVSFILFLNGFFNI